MAENVFEPHSVKQEAIIFSDAELTIAATGVQYGKTLSGVLWLKLLYFSHPEETNNFIVTAPTYKILQQSTLPEFLRQMKGFEQFYNKADAEFRIPGCGTIYFRTATDPDSIVGVTNVRGIYGDEAGKYPLYFWENMQGRQSTFNCPIMLTTSPYTRNWIYKDLIRPKQRGQFSDKELKLIQAASWENPYNSLSDPKIRAKRKATMDPMRFQMLFGGEWGQMEGLVYKCWSDADNLVDSFELPPGTRFFGGIDWGFTDPFVFKIRAFTPSGNQYGIYEFYKARKTLKEQIEVVQKALQLFPVERIFCGTDQPGNIEEFQRNKIPVQGADTSRGTIRRGIDLHYELIASRRYQEFRGACPYSMDEREMYHYPEPVALLPDQDSKEQLPVGQHDHAMDVDRYITLGTQHIFKSKKPKEWVSTNPFKDLYKPKKTQTEVWG